MKLKRCNVKKVGMTIGSVGLSFVLMLSSLAGALPAYAAQPETVSVSENDVHKQTVVSENDMMSDMSTAAGDVAINATNFPDEKFRSVVSAVADTSKDGVLSREEILAVTDLQVVYDSGDTDASLKGIEFFTELELLYCDGGKLENVDLSKNTKLDNLQITYTDLYSIDLSANTQLTYLRLCKNNLRELDLSKNTKLYYVSVEGNNLTSLQLPKTETMQNLSVYDNLLSRLDISVCPNLEYLECFENQIQELNLSANTQLRYLDCSDNIITSLDVSKQILLESLSCENNLLTTLDVRKLNALKCLKCSGNEIESLDLSGNPKLEIISFFSNPMKCIDLSYNPLLTKIDGLGKNSFEWIIPTDMTSIDMADIPGMDVSKISRTSSCTLDGMVLTFEEGKDRCAYYYRVETPALGEQELLFVIQKGKQRVRKVIIDTSATIPVVGQKPVYLKAKEEEPYTFGTQKWTEKDTGEEVSVFESGKEYDYSLDIILKKDYYCDSPSVVLLNFEAYELSCSSDSEGVFVRAGYIVPKSHSEYAHWYPEIYYDCGDGSSHYQLCTCGEKKVSSHEWNEQITKKATCTVKGEKKFTCKKCGVVMTEAYLEPHAFVYVPAKSATVHEAGSLAYYTCKLCGKFFADKDGKKELTASDVQISVLKNNVKTGTTFRHKKTNGIYKVTSTKKKTVSYIKPINKKKKSYKIPNTVSYKGVTYKVTAIAKNAFKNNKKIKKVTIGKYVKKIGANAFYKCKKLKTIVVKTSKLKKNTVGKKAISGIYKKAIIKVPKSKVKAYKKVFTSKTGYKKTMKIKK